MSIQGSRYSPPTGSLNRAETAEARGNVEKLDKKIAWHADCARHHQELAESMTEVRDRLVREIEDLGYQAEGKVA